MTADWTDRILDLDVGAVAHGGHCVARSEGRVVFVRHALPGERVRAVVSEDGGGAFCRADAVAVLDASPDRVPSSCVWARAGGCGGCDLQHADPAAQRALKGAVLAEQLQRLAGVVRPTVVEELPGGPLGWRHRVRLAVDAAGRAGLRAHRSHDVLPIADCPLAPAGTLPSVLAHSFEPGGEVEIASDADGLLHVDAPGPQAGGFPEDGPVVQRAVGREWRLSPGVFWQVHPALPDTLAAVVAQWADAPAGGVAWDLYGGVGLFAAVLAEQVGPDGGVTVVESSRQAVADGRAALADLPQIGWRVGRVERLVETLDGQPDVVVADPPRKGLGKALVEALCDRGPQRVVHVACDPAALARDVSLFEARGYALTELRAFDAFPMTHHFECVALFVRV
ncbi:class I SAM-dependent RNA methyltransferase [Pseudonocardia abyssalis]|uniref:Class I SAM-dependent RNA methyltransferase n=1 Tax=Pseudonocardia abyssalis TaxID=2792008 RepID=A0ABS6UQR9_9PSEU|nr:TRAM domain-containing protein [Pseudonocardia abyssalis]MBW0115738.1 class I SAM-dependent RNA methyltransferase [Pseudonocardia abyssalis]MBW0134603.1 class I SAM-dependent RNA methyltransferase [Pseudonocardia abyssalis]